MLILKKSFLAIILLMVINNNFCSAQKITSAELFEEIKNNFHPKVYSCGSPLSELAVFIKSATRVSHGIITPTIMSSIKVFLEREGKNGNNPYNTFYEDIAIYLEGKYTLNGSEIKNQECSICFENFRMEVLLSCNHIFCYKCLFEWYTQHNLKKEDCMTRCPLCKEKFDESVIALFITDPLYKEKSDAAMKEYDRQELEMTILHILFFNQRD